MTKPHDERIEQIADDRIRAMYGFSVVDAEGSELGDVEQVYLDDGSGEPSWVSYLDTRLLGSDREVFVPLRDATIEGSTIRSAHSRETLENAPTVGGSGQLGAAEEDRLDAHFGYLDRDRDPDAAVSRRSLADGLEGATLIGSASDIVAERAENEEGFGAHFDPHGSDGRKAPHDEQAGERLDKRAGQDDDPQPGLGAAAIT